MRKAWRARDWEGKSLSKVTGIAADPTRQAYWLVTASGGVHGFT